MTDARLTMTTAAEADGAPRIVGLDILRGLAILGILFMNINDMGGSIWAFWAGDIRHIGWTRVDQAVWVLREVLADGTARCLLEMLFGVGMVILTDRASQVAAARRAVLRSYYRRNILLFLFGLVHMFVLLWPGDILHTYGLAALVAVWFRRLEPKWLLGIGVLMALFQLAGGGYSYLAVAGHRAEVLRLEAAQARGVKLTADDTKTLKAVLDRRAASEQTEREDAGRIAGEDIARRAATGTLRTWATAAWGFTLHLQKQGMELLFVWEAAATMLIGAALYRWGIIQGARSRRFYLWATVIAYAFGLGSRTVGAFETMRFDDAPSILWALYEPARLSTTIGHIGLVHLLLGTALGMRLLKPFAAAGRTALTIYICQTIICLWVLYPPFAFGLYGTQGWTALMLTAVAIDALLLWAANRYVSRYRIAPGEWAWRSLVAGRRLPIRRRAVPPARGGVPIAA